MDQRDNRTEQEIKEAEDKPEEKPTEEKLTDEELDKVAGGGKAYY